jgi:hypothetical protein
VVSVVDVRHQIVRGGENTPIAPHSGDEVFTRDHVSTHHPETIAREERLNVIHNVIHLAEHLSAERLLSVSTYRSAG